MNKILLIISFISLLLCSNISGQFLDSVTVVKHPYLKSSLTLLTVNIALNRVNRYILPSGKEWADVSLSSWCDNIRTRPEWDWDLFTTNWFAHPYSGSMYYNSARTLGLPYWQSAGYTVVGTVMWEYFGEVLPPSINDFYTNILGGFHLGEVMFRISENILDDRLSGTKRLTREGLNFFINPIGEYNRLIYGMTNDHTLGSNHLHRPMTVKISAAGNLILNSTMSVDKKVIPHLEIDIQYGDLDKFRHSFKPFDIFWFKGWFRFDKRTNEEISGFPQPYWNWKSSAIIFGKSLYQTENEHQIIGIFQDYDYIKTNEYEIGSLGFSGGWLKNGTYSKWNNSLRIHAGLIILGAANSTTAEWEKPEDPDAFRDYVMGSGIFTKLEGNLDFKEYGSFTLRHDFWNLWVISGPNGHETLNTLSARYNYPFSTKVSIGIEYNRYTRAAAYPTSTENFTARDINSEFRLLSTYNL